MDTVQPGSQQSSLESLRTVEFRQTLRGYHIDDVDEYLERVAVEAEALQEQLRQTSTRLEQAVERITQLERQGAETPQAPTQVIADDTLQRTLLLAQQFVDQTKAEAESNARAVLAEAEERARALITDAETRAQRTTEEAQRALRDEVARLEGVRNQLVADVDTVARHLDAERARLRGALSEMLSWVDEHIQPGTSMLASSKRDGAGTQAAGKPAASLPSPPNSQARASTGAAQPSGGNAGHGSTLPVQQASFGSMGGPGASAPASAGGDTRLGSARPADDRISPVSTGR
jgi:DivIVA domain-containing protein